MVCYKYINSRTVEIDIDSDTVILKLLISAILSTNGNGMFILKKTLVGLLAIVTFRQIFAAPIPVTSPGPPPFVAPASILEQQNKDLQRSLDQRQIREQMQLSEDKYKESQKKQTQTLLSGDDKQMVYVKTIHLMNSGAIKYDATVKNILNIYSNKSLSNTDIFNLIKELSNFLYDNGYSTTIVALAPIAYENQTLNIEIKWGRIDGYLINGKKIENNSDKILIGTSFPRCRGDILKMSDIDQAIENSNSSFQSTKINIEPSDKDGFSNLDYIVEKNYIPTFMLSTTNNGNSDTNGRYKYSGTINYGNVLNFNERYTLGGTIRKFDDDNFSENSMYFMFGFPIGYLDFNSFYSYSYSRTPTFISAQNFPYESKLQSYYFTLSSKLYRYKNNSINFRQKLNFKETKNYLDGDLLISSSKNYSDYTIGLDGTTSSEYGVFYFSLNYLMGVNFNDNTKAAFVNNQPKLPKLVQGDISYSKSWSLWNREISLYSTGSYQYAGSQMLISSYRTSLGDEYSIRGLNGNTALSYDSSIYLNNTLSMQFLINEKLNLVPQIGFDFGAGKNNQTKESDTFYSASTGFKINYSLFSMNLFYGKLLYLSNKQELPKGIFYFNGSMRF